MHIKEKYSASVKTYHHTQSPLKVTT